MKKSLFSLFFVTSIALAQHWGFYIGGAEMEGGKVRNDLFLPIIEKEDFITFIDLRQVAFAGDLNVTHVGLGIRKEMEQKVVLGANASFANGLNGDGRGYKRITYGIEVLTSFLDYRLNFYQGLDEHRIASTETVGAFLNDQNRVQMQIDQQDRYQAALHGVDLMLGNNFSLGSDIDFGVHAGFYSFYRDGYEGVTGGQVNLSFEKRFELKTNLAGEFGVEGLYRYDNQNGHRLTGGFNLGLSFGSLKKKDKAQDMRLALNHQDYLYTGQRVEDLPTRTVDATVNIGGHSYSEIALLENSDDFVDMIKNAAPGTLVVLDGGSGNFLLGSQVLTTNDGQDLAGGGTLVLVTDVQGHQAVLALPGDGADLISIGEGGVNLGNDSAMININHHHLKGMISAGKNEIVNGSFENGHNLGTDQWGVYSEVEGWLADLDEVDAPIEIQNGDNVGGVAASDGSAKLELDSHNKDGFENSNAHVYQDVETLKGESYRLTLDYSARIEGASTSGVEVYVDGELVLTLDHDFTGWETKEIVFNATSECTRIEFRGIGAEDTLGGYIDNVRMERISL